MARIPKSITDYTSALLLFCLHALFSVSQMRHQCVASATRLHDPAPKGCVCVPRLCLFCPAFAEQKSHAQRNHKQCARSFCFHIRPPVFLDEV